MSEAESKGIASSTAPGSNAEAFGSNAALLVTLILLIGVVPFLPGERFEDVFGRIIWSTLIIVGIARSRGRPIFLWAALIIAIPSILSRWIDVFGLADAGPMVEALFLLLLSSHILTDIFSQRRVHLDQVLGGINVYLLLGVLFARLHVAVEKNAAGSYMLGDLPLAAAAMRAGQQLDDLLQYFSFTTLTTLGYGDIRPVGHAARVLSTTEAVVGQLFVAILIARLVSVYASNRSND